MTNPHHITKTALHLVFVSLLLAVMQMVTPLQANVRADGPETAPGMAAEEETCESCHVGAAKDFSLSRKSAFMDCTDCHGKEHTGPDTGDPGVVTPKTCQKCHADQVSQFNEGKHYYGWEAMEVVPTYSTMPAAVTEKGCVTCHRIGAIWDDGSRGRCDLCHSRHLFSAEEAKKPEACGTCHTGDHPHYEMWANSKHGMLYAMGNNEERTPTCVTCHDSHKVLTAWGFLGLRESDQDDPEWTEARAKVQQTLETMGPAHAPEVKRSSFAEWQSAREEMVSRCAQCHAESWSRRELEKGDALLREADLAQAKVIDLANMLYDDELIDDATRFSIYRESTSHRFSAYMGGFHNSANYAWDRGYLELVQGMVAERNQAIETKKLSVIRGKIGQLLPLGIAGLSVAVVSLLLILWFWFRFLRKQARDKT